MKEHVAEENDTKEVTQAWTDNPKTYKTIEGAITDDASTQRKIQVKNTYFEWVPARFVHGYITDEGLWSAQDIVRRSDWISGEMDRFFKNL